MSKRKNIDSLYVGCRVQLLWELDDATLAYFSATVTEQIGDQSFRILYDRVSDDFKSSEATVDVIDGDTVNDPEQSCELKWRLEPPAVAIQKDVEGLKCPKGHDMSRDFANVNMRTCECCLSCYWSETGQWECSESSCDDWGACDACVVTYNQVGHWSLAEELAEEPQDQVVTLAEAIDEIGEAVAAEATEAASAIERMPFLQRSMLARGYRQFLDTMVNGVTELMKEKGDGYVITKEDVKRIADNLPSLDQPLHE